MTGPEYIRPRANGYLPTAPDANGIWMPILDVTVAPSRAQATVAWYYDAGYQLGRLRGRDEVLAEQETIIVAAQTEAADVVRRIAQIPPYDELEERRGRPERAERVRAQWRKTGLTGGVA